MENQNNKIVLFQEKSVRRIWHNERWYFVLNDVIEVLTNTTNVKDYIKKMRKRDDALNLFWGTNCPLVEMAGESGKKRKFSCADTEGIFRILMSVPSPNAEPFKLWLAQVGSERMDEIENPELGIERIRELYKAKGYSDEWISSRLKSIDIRKELTEEWQNRGVKEGQEYSILTAEIAKATFGLTPSNHKTLKNLDKQNLRDHMTSLELIFSMLGEESTRLFAVEGDAQGFDENRETALKGGKAAGDARRNFEKSGQKVVSSENFLKQIEEAEKKTPTIENIEIKNDET